MRGFRRRSREGATPPARMSARLNLLIGERRTLVAALAGTSVLSAVCEAATLAVIAQIAVEIAGKGHQHLQGLHIHASTHKLILIAAGLAGLRLLLQFPLSILPARIAGDVQAALRKRLFHAFTVASWSVQSSDREGQLQETMSGQVMQATVGALQATTLITMSLTFLVLMAF